MKNVTLSVEDTVLERAREAAEKRGKSLNALIREYLEELGGRNRRSTAAQTLQRLWAESSGRSGGRKIRREDAYEEGT
jgi:hypothetical protein